MLRHCSSGLNANGSNASSVHISMFITSLLFSKAHDNNLTGIKMALPKHPLISDASEMFLNIKLRHVLKWTASSSKLLIEEVVAGVQDSGLEGLGILPSLEAGREVYHQILCDSKLH